MMRLGRKWVWVWPNLSCSWGRKKKKDLGPGREMGWGQVLSRPGRERRSLARGTEGLTARSGGTRGPSSVTGGPASPEGTLGLPENATIYPSCSRPAPGWSMKNRSQDRGRARFHPPA